MSERKASEVFVGGLEAEGVRYVFGIPGEETLDLNESLADSSIEFVPVRHEQGGAYMADAYGRLTGRAGVCLGTLGPGATNLVTAVADAFLDRAPLVALTGQSDIERMHKESHQYIDLIGIMRPIVKWNARVAAPARRLAAPPPRPRPARARRQGAPARRRHDRRGPQAARARRQRRDPRPRGSGAAPVALPQALEPEPR
jgi:glyoxylate carboligase